MPACSAWCSSRARARRKRVSRLVERLLVPGRTCHRQLPPTSNTNLSAASLFTPAGVARGERTGIERIGGGRRGELVATRSMRAWVSGAPPGGSSPQERTVLISPQHTTHSAPCASSAPGAAFQAPAASRASRAAALATAASRPSVSAQLPYAPRCTAAVWPIRAAMLLTLRP